MLAVGERAELAIDERDQLARQVIGVVADGGRVDVLVAAERGEAIRQHEDRRPHSSLINQPRRALGDVVAEVLPADVREAGAGEADHVPEHRKAAARAVVVLRRQPYRELADVRIAPRIVLEDLRDVLEHHDGARRTFLSLEHDGMHFAHLRAPFNWLEKKSCSASRSSSLRWLPPPRASCCCLPACSRQARLPPPRPSWCSSSPGWWA